jgi:hypothetical protein
MRYNAKVQYIHEENRGVTGVYVYRQDQLECISATGAEISARCITFAQLFPPLLSINLGSLRLYIHHFGERNDKYVGLSSC